MIHVDAGIALKRYRLCPCQSGNGDKPLCRSAFPAPYGAAVGPVIWSFASPEGFVIRSPREHLFRLFLGSSAVEHSTVNRMVAGSNPARGASYLFDLIE
jgi:hypothetical protein